MYNNETQNDCTTVHDLPAAASTVHQRKHLEVFANTQSRLLVHIRVLNLHVHVLRSTTVYTF